MQVFFQKPQPKWWIQENSIRYQIISKGKGFSSIYPSFGSSRSFSNFQHIKFLLYFPSNSIKLFILFTVTCRVWQYFLPSYTSLTLFFLVYYILWEMYRLLSHPDHLEGDITIIPSHDFLSSSNSRSRCCKIYSPFQVASYAGNHLHTTKYSRMTLLIILNSLI